MPKRLSARSFARSRENVDERRESVVLRRQADKALGHEHDLVSRIMETSPIGITLLNREGEITFANANAERVLGLSKDEVTSRTYNAPDWHITGFDGEPFPDEALAFRQVMASGKPVYDVRHAIETTDGRRILLSINAAPVFAESGELDGMVTAIEDVTERYEAERELSALNARLEKAGRVARMGFLDWNLKTNELVCSNEVYRLYGVTRDKATTPDFIASVVHADDVERVQKNLELAIQGEKQYDIDHRIVRPNGDVLWVHAQGELSRDADGNPETLLGTIVDISERKRAEEAYREERDQAQTYLDLAGVMMIALDAKGRITLINRRGCEILGYKEEELLGRNWFETCLPPAGSDDVELVFRSLMAGAIEPVEYFENDVLTKDGGRRLIAFRNTVIRNESSQIVGALSSGEDITERKLAQEALSASEERYRRLTENAPDVIFRFRYEPEPILDYVSPVTTEVAGYSPEDYYTDPGLLRSLVFPDDLPQFEALLQSKKNGAGLLRWTHKDGRLIWTDVRTVPILDDEGELVAMEGVLRDVTEQKQAEEERELLSAELLQSQKMEAVGRLAGGVAHNFNNLLTAIAGYSDLLLAKISEDSELRSDAEQIKRASERAADVTRGLLLFSRRERGRREHLDLNDVVSDMGMLLRQLIRSDVEIATSLGSNLGLVEGDRSQLEQALVNLVVNAHDAMPEGGKLEIETANLDLSEPLSVADTSLSSGRYVTLSVRDTGSGMDDETLARIFEPFFTTKGPDRGTGLGLSTVFGIVEEIGGRILVESQLGRGTTFTIVVPRCK